MSKRPNPVNGKTVKHQDPTLVHTKEELAMAVGFAQRDARRKVLQELGVTDLCAVSTPAALWAVEAASEDPFPELINKERGSLVLGNHTDDQLANEVFLYGDMSTEEKARAMITGKCSSVAYLTAGKERIRWLSRHLESALAREQKLLAIVNSTSVPADDVWEFLKENDEYQGYNPDYFRKRALEILPSHYVDKKMQPILTKMYLEGDIDKDGTRSGCLGSVVKYSGPIFEGTIPAEENITPSNEELVEEQAEVIYNSWKDQKGWTPWVKRGNSNMQVKARREAADKLATSAGGKNE